MSLYSYDYPMMKTNHGNIKIQNDFLLCNKVINHLIDLSDDSQSNIATGDLWFSVFISIGSRLTYEVKV